MSRQISVFLSSTFKDLEEERRRVKEALEKLDGVRVLAMENFGSRPTSPARVSVEQVDEADLYVGVIANRYGSGITEQEYAEAKRLGLSRLIYLYERPSEDPQPPDPQGPRLTDPQLEAFKELLQSELTVATVRSIDELVTMVLAGVSNQKHLAGLATMPEQLWDLPYLVDRDPQVATIEGKVKALLGDRREARPLTAFVIPGVVADLHAGLVRRYEAFHLPKLFLESRSQGPGIDGLTRLSWPDVDGADSRFAQISSALNESMGLESDASTEVTYSALRGLGRTRLFVYFVPVASWTSDFPIVLRRSIEFWRGLRSPAGAVPLVFFCLQFAREPQSGWLGAMPPLSAAGRADRAARKWLKEIEASDDICVLKPLTTIDPSHVQDWAQTRCSQYRKDLNIPLLTARVIQAKMGPSTRMSDLVEPLQAALANAWTPRQR